MFSSCLSWSLMFWTTFPVYSRFPEACPALGVNRIIMSHRHAMSPIETTCIRFHLRRTKWRAFLRSFRHFRLLSCGKKWMAVKMDSEQWCRSWHPRDATSCATHHAWNCLLSNCLRAVCWIRHTWFGLLGPGSSCQITSPEQLGGCGTQSHHRTSAFDDHLYHCFVVFENVRRWFFLWEMCVRWNLIYVRHIHILIQHLFSIWCDLGLKHWFPVCMLGLVLVLFGVIPNTSMTKSYRSSASKPSTRKPASNDMISDSVQLCDTDVCFLHIQPIGTYVPLPKMHQTPTDVDFESSRSTAKSESWNNRNLQCWVALPTWQHWE